MPRKLSQDELRRRSDVIREGITLGRAMSATARIMGMTPSNLHLLIERHPWLLTGVPPAGPIGAAGRVIPQPLPELTEAQLEMARRLDITPDRLAWLLTCPRGGNAAGWRGGSAIG